MTRMWFVPLATLCDRHLRAAHNEVKTWLARRRLGQGSDGYYRQGVWDPRPEAMRAYAQGIREELRRRGRKAPTPPRLAGLDLAGDVARWRRLDPFLLAGREDLRAARDAAELAERCGCGPLGAAPGAAEQRKP
jgi:hypothetical protein